MKEENYTIKSELDAKIFKVITRCLKENGTLRCHKFGDILKNCYDSRKGHPGEDMLFNASYWIDDAKLYLKPHLRLMYYVYISNLIVGKGLVAKSTNFLQRFESQLTDLTTNALNYRSLDKFYDVFNAHYDAIRKAFSVLYSEEAANDKIDCINLIFKGIQKNIPFQMLDILKKINSTLTIIATVYTVSKLMMDVFKKYEKKHGKKV